MQLALGNQGAYLRALFELRDLSEKLRERELLMWVTVRIAEHHSRVGEHGQALQAVYRFETMQPGMTTPPSLVVLRGVLARRRGDYPLAIRHLEEGVALLRERGQLPELTRALLQLAYALYSARRREEATNVLGSALQGLLQLHTQPDFRHELEEAAELLHYASLEPDLASFLEPVLNNLAGLAGSPRLSAAEQIPLHVYTLGRQEVVRREEVLHFTLKGTPLLLVYLALNPNRTRGELELALYPDKDPVAAGNYVRSAIRELREALGQDAVIMEGSRHAPRYRLGPHLRVDLDLVRFLEAINHGELARALALYQGVFMPEIDDSPWVEHKREEARLALEFELRNQITCGREQGNLRRVILLCNQYLRFEPYDRDVHLERVQAARVVGGAGELARYISELQALED
ncbi:DNA-binding SARP family transcriptional activator [Deinobacterium chartae]|uniref:DNA-binding SARP family transcriptional activator n=1 Tax=Deinobacterium chartae TaxID=521158 RepID=A0A841HUG8_9DEIO|nr:hypothetical protein [Deinobacterium chartae]MBB6096997.1 DNA-binding SARP family transcriptional activator [Deinobacterium chartae]